MIVWQFSALKTLKRFIDKKEMTLEKIDDQYFLVSMRRHDARYNRAETRLRWELGGGPLPDSTIEVQGGIVIRTRIHQDWLTETRKKSLDKML